MSIAAFNTWESLDGATSVNIQDILTASSLGAVGSSLIGYKPPASGSVARTLTSKLLESISVKDFGAVGNGVADDTAAVQAAVNYAGSIGGARVLFPCGTYSVSSPITLTSSSVQLVGESRFSSLIQSSVASNKIISCTAAFCGVDELSFRYSGTPVSGAVAVYNEGAYFRMTGFIVRNAFVGVHYNTAAAVGGSMTDFQILDYVSIGILAQSLNDLFISKFVLNAGNTTRGALGGIRLYNKTEAIVVTDGDILLGQFSMTMAADSYAQALRPAYNNFTNVFFDSAANSTVIAQTVNTEFVGCWFSGGRVGGGVPGADLSNCANIRFVSCRFFNCGGAGVNVQGTAQRVTFIGCDASSNSASAGSGNAHGFSFGNGCAGFSLIGCTGTNGLEVGVQGYGVFIGTGCNNFSITNSNFLGNNNGAIGGDLSGAGVSIQNTLGMKTYAKSTAAIAVGQTVTTVTHGLGYTPQPQDIRLVATSSPVSSGVASWYVTAVTASTFQIAVNAAVAGSTMNFGWDVQVLKA